MEHTLKIRIQQLEFQMQDKLDHISNLEIALTEAKSKQNESKMNAVKAEQEDPSTNHLIEIYQKELRQYQHEVQQLKNEKTKEKTDGSDLNQLWNENNQMRNQLMKLSNDLSEKTVRCEQKEHDVITLTETCSS